MEGQKQIEFSQPYFKINSKEKLFSVHESLNAFLRPCGRFTSPLSWYEILELKILRNMSTSKVFKHIVAFPNYEILPNWQILLNYLASKKLIPRPSFAPLTQRNDFPHTSKVRLESRVTEEVTDGWSLDIKGFGSSAEAEEAYSKSVGEFLERYMLTIYRSKQLKFGSYNTLTRSGMQALNTESLPKFLPWQMKEFKEFVYSNDSQLHWAQTTELISGKRTYVPAQLVFWNYNRSSANEPYLQDSTTNGQAGHFTFEESALGSIYELVERDAFLIFWLNTLSPNRISPETIDDPSIKGRIKSLQNSGLKVFYLDTTTDLGIPSCVCIILDSRGVEPRIALGGSAGFDVYKNLTSSLNEALSVAQHSTTYDLPLEYRPFLERKIGMKERVGMWRGADMLAHSNFFISGKEIAFSESKHFSFGKIFSSKQNELEEVKRIFKNKGSGYELYCYRARHSVLDALGYVVTKVVVPNLMPLYLQEHMATLGVQRLHDVPKMLGYKEATLNLWPHPFS